MSHLSDTVLQLSDQTQLNRQSNDPPLTASIDPLIEQANNQSNLPLYNKHNQTIYDDMKDQSIYRSNNESDNRLDNHAINQSPNHFYEQSISRINNMKVSHSNNQMNHQSNNPSNTLSPTNQFSQSGHIPPFLRRVSPLARREPGVRLRSSIHEQLVNQSTNNSTTTNQYIVPPLRRTASGTKLSHKNFAFIVNTRSVEDFGTFRNQPNDPSNTRHGERLYYQLDDGSQSDLQSMDQSNIPSSDSDSFDLSITERPSLSINVLQPSPMAQRNNRSNSQTNNQTNNQSNNQSNSQSNSQSSPTHSSSSPLESPRVLALSLLRSNSISFHDLAPLPEAALTVQTDQSNNQTIKQSTNQSNNHSINHSPAATPNAVIDALEAPLPLSADLIKSPEGELLKEQLDGTLKKRGDSYLNFASLDASPAQPVELAVPIPPQLRGVSGADRRVRFRTDGTDGLDIIELIKEERPAHDEVIDEETWRPRLPIKHLWPRPQPKHGVLRTVNIRGTDEEIRRRERRAGAREREWIAIMQAGALFTKYSWQDGKPQQRWFWVSDDTHDLCWEKPNNQWKKSPPVKFYDSDPEDNMPLPPVSTRSMSYSVRANRKQVVAPPLQSANSAPSIHEPQKKRRASLPSAMRIFSLKFQNDRKRSLLDISGVHYGPYRSTRFQRYLAHKDNAVGYAWLCMTIVFQDRTLDLVACDEPQVTSWFMGMQCLAPLSVHNLTLGGLLWRRLIMKLNHFGLAPVKLEKVSQWHELG